MTATVDAIREVLASTDSLPAWHRLRRRLGLDGEFLDQLKHLESESRNDPTVDAFRLGMMQWMMGRHEAAAESLATVKPATEHSRYFLTLSLLELNRLEEADEVMKHEKSATLESPMPVFAKAEVQLQRGELDACEEILQAALETMPPGIRALVDRIEREKVGLGNTPVSLDRLVEVADEVIEDVESLDDTVRLEWAQYFYIRGLLTDTRTGANTPQRAWFIRYAMMDFLVANALDPMHAGVIFRLAYYADLYGDDELAMAYYERLKDTTPLHEHTLLNLGVLYEDRGEYDQAAECFRLILKHNPNHARAALFLKDSEASTSMYYDEDQERREDKRAAVLRTPVTEFELSVRSRNCLSRMKIDTLGDLIQKSEQELLSYKNFGETSLQEIKAILVTKGLRLGMAGGDAEEIPVDTERSSREELLSKPVGDLELSVRIRKVMERLGIKTLGDLTQHKESEFTQLRNFGKTSLSELKKKLAEMDLSLSN